MEFSFRGQILLAETTESLKDRREPHSDTHAQFVILHISQDVINAPH